MENIGSRFVARAPHILGVLRIVTGFLFLQHGSAKLFGAPHIAMFDGLQIVSLMYFPHRAAAHSASTGRSAKRNRAI